MPHFNNTVDNRYYQLDFADRMEGTDALLTKYSRQGYKEDDNDNCLQLPQIYSIYCRVIS